MRIHVLDMTAPMSTAIFAVAGRCLPWIAARFQASVQVTGTSPMSVLSRSAFHTAAEASTMLSLHPLLESHSSTTFACAVRPLCSLVMRIIFRHRRPPPYQRVDSATIISLLLWYLSSHFDGPPPSWPFSNPFSVITPWCCATAHNVDTCSSITSMAANPRLVMAIAKLLPMLICWPFQL
uniref:Uncharacterized protein n=1 Tax=Triticum urartu TaxID=4572 RepID=A0A8R7UCZ6_TRIUA